MINTNPAFYVFKLQSGGGGGGALNKPHLKQNAEKPKAKKK
jgi:hypothetical protein